MYVCMYGLPWRHGGTGCMWVRIPGSGRAPGEGNGNLLQSSCLKNFHGQRNLVGYSPRGHKELDTTDHEHSYNQLQP